MNRSKPFFSALLSLIALFFLGYGLWNISQAHSLEANTQILANKLEQVESRTNELEEISELSTRETISAEIEAEQLAIAIQKCKNP